MKSNDDVYMHIMMVFFDKVNIVRINDRGGQNEIHLCGGEMKGFHLLGYII